MRLLQRLTTLETKSGVYSPHVVVWGKGQSFADTLARLPYFEGATSRMLIEISFVGDDPLTPEQLSEQAKAHAWADNLEAA